MMKYLFMLAALISPLYAMADIFYVDHNISSNCLNYAPSKRACGAGKAVAFANTRSALNNISAGDTLFLRGGMYKQLNIKKSGDISNPIVIRGFNGEAVVVSGQGVAINIINQANVIIRDLTVRNVLGFARIENSTGITLQSISFSGAAASGTTGALKIVSSRNNRIINNTFSDGSDLLILQDDANFNLLKGNRFGRSAHSSISIRCSSKNILRANVFNNPDQKALEIYDCEGVSDAPVRLDDTKRNLIEYNQFLGTRGSSASYRYNAIQHGGQQTIVRYNVFANNLGGGVSYQYYPEESLYNYQNRLYNNTFYNNHCYAIMGSKGPKNRYYDNRAVNNLLFKNKDCTGADQQTVITNSETVILSHNSLLNRDPGFTNAARLDLSLTQGSKQIDAGAYIARTVSAGSGRELIVDDASWFVDGFAIAGETGDQIRIEGQNNVATVLSINYVTNTLLLSTPLTWHKGDGVHLNYLGNAPDVGAFEFKEKPLPVPLVKH